MYLLHLYHPYIPVFLQIRRDGFFSPLGVHPVGVNLHCNS